MMMSEITSGMQPTATATAAMFSLDLPAVRQSNCGQFYKHTLMGDFKTNNLRCSDYSGSDVWQEKYYGGTSMMGCHPNTLSSALNQQAKHYTSRFDPVTSQSCSNGYHVNYPSNDVTKPYSCLTTNAATQSHQLTLQQWQQSLQQQQTTQHLQQKFANQIPADPAKTPTENSPSPISQPSRFDMFLRGESVPTTESQCARSPVCFFQGLSDTSSSWNQSNTNKESYFQPQPTKNICPVCGKNYARPSTLKTHMRIHSGERPFHCKVCQKSFSQAANLTAHLRVHSGEKPFSCSICRKTFSQSSSVTTHMRTHSGDRPYKCPMCRKGFSDSSTLTKHLRIHSGEKPYRCQFCSMSFSQSGNLNRHMKVHEHQPKNNPTSSGSPLLE